MYCVLFDKGSDDFATCRVLIKAFEALAELNNDRQELFLPVWSSLSLLYAKNGYYLEAIRLMRGVLHIAQSLETKVYPEKIFYWGA